MTGRRDRDVISADVKEGAYTVLDTSGIGLKDEGR